MDPNHFLWGRRLCSEFCGISEDWDEMPKNLCKICPGFIKWERNTFSQPSPLAYTSLIFLQIKTWFQNRRMKLKRQQQEMRPDPFHSAPFYSSLAFGHQSGPLSYVYPPHQQAFIRREAFPSSVTYPTMSAPTLDSISASGGQSGALWPMPYFMGYQDPRTIFLTLWIN